MRDPSFWWDESAFPALLLRPIAFGYGLLTASRLQQTGARVTVPVVCVGNFTLGGAGKTPTALALAKLLSDLGESPYFLTRGYGGSLPGPVQVNAVTHSARDVGDEALLLARRAPTIVCADRLAGANAAIEAGASVLIMDDGLQNPSLVKDVAIAVVDGRREIGNGYVFPAGPLRAPLRAQMAIIDAMLAIDDRSKGTSAPFDAARAAGVPVWNARLQPDAAVVKAVSARKVLAFAGIGDPEKFFSTLAVSGIEAIGEESFPDHHFYTEADAQRLLERCDKGALIPVTTEKDFVRLSGSPALTKLAARTRAVPVTLVFQDEAKIRQWFKSKLAARTKS